MFARTMQMHTLTTNDVDKPMEFGEGPIFFTAVVEKKQVTEKYVKIRYHKKKKMFGTDYPSHEINAIWLSDDEYAKKQYWQACKLHSGDEIWVEINGDEWSLPEHKCGFFRRVWNLLFH